MPPKGFRKQSTTATPQLLSAALGIVRVLRESEPTSLNLAMAEKGLEDELRLQAPPPAVQLTPYEEQLRDESARERAVELGARD